MCKNMFFRKFDEEKYFDEVRRIEEDFFNLTSNFSSVFPKILNVNSEKKKFFTALVDDKVYNPKFVYEVAEFDNEAFEKLKALKVDTKRDYYNLKKLLKKRIEVKILELETRKYWGNEKSYLVEKRYRGVPSIYLVSLAKKYCREFKRERVRFRKISSEKLADELKKEVFKLTGDELEVRFENISAKVNIIAHKNLVQINPENDFTTLDLKRLKVHEIGVHYLRYFNGHRLGFRLFEVGTANYLETEEGLAVYFEELMGVSSRAQMYIYAGRVIATYYAGKGSFYEVFKILKSYGFRDEAAWTITLRAKRNICDTSKHAGFMKDYVYFSGYLKIKKFVSRGGDVRDLFIGKIKIEDLRYLKKLILKNKSKIKTILK